MAVGRAIGVVEASLRVCASVILPGTETTEVCMAEVVGQDESKARLVERASSIHSARIPASRTRPVGRDSDDPSTPAAHNGFVSARRCTTDQRGSRHDASSHSLHTGFFANSLSCRRLSGAVGLIRSCRPNVRPVGSIKSVNSAVQLDGRISTLAPIAVLRRSA